MSFLNTVLSVGGQVVKSAEQLLKSDSQSQGTTASVKDAAPAGTHVEARAGFASPEDAALFRQMFGPERVVTAPVMPADAALQYSSQEKVAAAPPSGSGVQIGTALAIGIPIALIVVLVLARRA